MFKIIFVHFMLLILFTFLYQCIKKHCTYKVVQI